VAGAGGTGGSLSARRLHLHQASVCSFTVESPRHGREVNEGSEVGQRIAGLVVQDGHAADAVPQAQVASIAVKNEAVEPKNGVRAINGQQDGPR